MAAKAPAESIAKAVVELARGGVIAHPTETIFGLAVDPGNQQALERLLAIKGRKQKKGFILLVPGRNSLLNIVRPTALFDPVVTALMTQLWPGPVTMVLPVLPTISPLLTGGGEYVAVRHSPSPLVNQLLSAWQGIIVSTSANRSASGVLGDHQAVAAEFGPELGYVIPGHCQQKSKPSTIIKIAADKIELLRSGAMPIASIQAVLQKTASHLVLQTP